MSEPKQRLTTKAACADRDRLRQAIWALIDTLEGVVHAHETRGMSGQQVPYRGDFASVGPSVVGQMRRWSRDLRAALRGEWPMSREEFKASYPRTTKEALDEMFKERIP